MTQGVAGGLFLPSLFILALYRGSLPILLTQFGNLRCCIASMLVPTAYYILREVMQPGFLPAMLFNEISGRFFSTLEDNYHPWYFYVKQLIFSPWSWSSEGSAAPWIWLFPITAILALLSRAELPKQAARLALVVFLVYLLLISVSQRS